eukprot:637644_1
MGNANVRTEKKVDCITARNIILKPPSISTHFRTRFVLKYKINIVFSPEIDLDDTETISTTAVAINDAYMEFDADLNGSSRCSADTCSHTTTIPLAAPAHVTYQTVIYIKM